MFFIGVRLCILIKIIGFGRRYCRLVLVFIFGDRREGSRELGIWLRRIFFLSVMLFYFYIMDLFSNIYVIKNY